MNQWKKFIVAGFIVIVSIILADFSMQKRAEQPRGYSQANLWLYYFYTDKEIRDAPRVAHQYHFTFSAQDGAKPQDSSIVYSADANTADLADYLQSLGYIRLESEGAIDKWGREGELTPYFTLTREPVQRNVILTRTEFK
ncbi:hypothetical protein [Pantoea sp. A4]|uniref:hypothetical protein n=1 Tax=Pantoea sp. A4 TaxID=1225184 RepID=UPI00036E8A5C|nr:hypothetical protein [Pantoea sp. A4]